jgi:mono/diheme cytochrome c family protein
MAGCDVQPDDDRLMPVPNKSISTTFSRMIAMFRIALTCVLFVVLTTLLVVVVINPRFQAQPRGAGSPAALPTEWNEEVSRDPEVIERGRYLVTGIGLCIDCHTPRDERGSFVSAQLLHGAPIGFNPVVPMPWADMAPRLAGLTTFPASHVRRILTTGKRADGSAPRPPMPTYQLTMADADAVVAYINSLP